MIQTITFCKLVLHLSCLCQRHTGCKSELALLFLRLFCAGGQDKHQTAYRNMCEGEYRCG